MSEPNDMEFIKKVVNLFQSSDEPDENTFQVPLSLDETISVLEDSAEEKPQEPIEKKHEEIADNMCFEATGVVTHLDQHYGIIDKNLYFEFNNSANIEIGTTVLYLAYKTKGEIKISRIIDVKSDDWNEERLSSPKYMINHTNSCQVIGRKGRIIQLSTGFEIDLNKVESEFVPMVGDSLYVDTMVESDENIGNCLGRIIEARKIHPARYHYLKSIIKSFDKETQSGMIEKQILFFKDVCVPGYIPVINDKISVEVVEHQNGAYLWRALKVMPLSSAINKHCFAQPDKAEKELVRNKNDIILPEHTSANLQKIGERQIITFEIRNKGSDPQTIIAIIFKYSGAKSQLTVEHPTLDHEIMLKPKQSIFCRICCEARQMGTTKEMILVCFDGFTIGRWVKIQVIPNYLINQPKNHYYRNVKHLATAAWKSFQNVNTKEIIAGERPVKPPSFINNKLPSYEIPEAFARKIFGMMSEKILSDVPISQINPCFEENLSIETYQDIFHYLLYLEEIAIQVNLRKYDIPLANFIKNGEYLMLEVPDLSERRPSVIVGDKILAYDPIKIDSKPLEGHVHKTAKCHIYLKFNPNFHNRYNNEDYKIEFHSSRSNFRRYHQAIDLASRNLGKNMLFPNRLIKKEPQISFYCEDDEKKETTEKIIEIQDKEPEIKNKYLRFARKSIKNSSDDSKQSSSSGSDNDKINQPSSVDTNKLKLEWFDKKLNKYQKAAVKNILLGEARPLPYFIFGPPGTGKTVTLIETILQILRMIPQSRLLVCAPSNSAADLIALRLLDAGVLQPGDLVRMVAYRCIQEGTIPPRLVPFCVTGDLAREGSRENRNAMENGVNTNLQASSLGKHRITVGTCMVISVMYAMGFARGHFTHIILDEAGQATEPELMIPLSLLDVTSAQTVLAGDPMQLGPCVFSMVAKDNGLGDSYFERIIARFPYDRDPIGFPETGGYDPSLVTRLVFNYRSLPELLTCPNNLFYQNELKATISAEDSEEAALLMKLSPLLPQRKGRLPPALVFHGVRGQNHQTAECPSWFNPVEAGQVFYYLNDFYRLGVASHEIGVITPYLRQGQQVRELLLENNLELPKIGSVEEFQGQEFKIVILSCVRSNEIDAQNDSKLGLGFIASPRRLNVAVSRAQVLLIIIGNPHLLIMDKYWRNVLMYAIEIGGYTGCDLPKVPTV